MTFRKHIERAAGKAVESVRALSRLMSNMVGPSRRKKELLMSVVNSKLLYAAQTWARRATKFDINRRAMARAQRIAAIRIIRGYRMVKEEGALFYQISPPGDLFSLERSRIKERIAEIEPDTSAIEIQRLERAITVECW